MSEDFDLIGNAYYRWIRDREDLIGLNSKDSNSYFKWIIENLDYYARTYSQILAASKDIVTGLESIYYNAEHGFTLQYQILLASLHPRDNEKTTKLKLKLVADL